jgi:hypothetical protein
VRVRLVASRNLVMVQFERKEINRMKRIKEKE